MQFRRTLVSFIGLTVMLLSGELWLRHGLATQKSRIVFATVRFDNYEIYVMDADGKNQENLTNHPVDDNDPDWSPDGQKIAFVSWRDENNEIYMIGADGQGLERVTHDFPSQQNPSFSPDGRRIAYDTEHEGFGHIFVVGRMVKIP